MSLLIREATNNNDFKYTSASDLHPLIIKLMLAILLISPGTK